MSQWIEVVGMWERMDKDGLQKPGDPSLISGSLVREGEDVLQEVIL